MERVSAPLKKADLLTVAQYTVANLSYKPSPGFGQAPQATALRVSEVLALQWYDLDFEAQFIRVRGAYVERRFGKPKPKASKAPVPMQEILRHQNLKTTLAIYAKAMSEDKLEAQGLFLKKLFSQDQKKKSPRDVVSAKDIERVEPVVSSLQ
ncbi:MAG: hypothetical protein JWN74_97 [Acidobacteriaceae bacterium]|nr:hypothetical protein [Acidobacteriaceae bacterium]